MFFVVNIDWREDQKTEVREQMTDPSDCQFQIADCGMLRSGRNHRK